MSENYPNSEPITRESAKDAMMTLGFGDFIDDAMIDFIVNYEPEEDQSFKPKGLPLEIGSPRIARGNEMWYFGYNDQDVVVADIHFLAGLHGLPEGQHELGFPEEVDHDRTVLMASLMQAFLAYATLVQLKVLPTIAVFEGSTNPRMARAAKRFGFFTLPEITVRHFEGRQAPEITPELVRDLHYGVSYANEYDYLHVMYALAKKTDGVTSQYFEENFKLALEERYSAAVRREDFHLSASGIEYDEELSSIDVYGAFPEVMDRMKEYTTRNYLGFVSKARKIAERALDEN